MRFHLGKNFSCCMSCKQYWFYVAVMSAVGKIESNGLSHVFLKL